MLDGAKVMLLSATALLAGGCYLYRVPLQPGQIEDRGEGTMTVIESRDEPAGPGRRLSVPITTAVYEAAGGRPGRQTVEFGLFARTDDPNRPTLSTTHYLSFELAVEPGGDRIVEFRAPSAILLAKPHRDRSVLYRFARCPEPAVLARSADGRIRGRFVFEMTYIVGMPAGDRRPVRVEVDFTAEPDGESLRRLRQTAGGTARGLEEIHRARTSRPGAGRLDAPEAAEPAGEAP
jgi:hypothetical protein